MRGMALVFFVAATIGLIPVVLDIVPPPAVHDEFAYLLQAETFFRGRLTNPTPPRPEFFETIHVLVRPTYAAKFPPAPALTMAAAMRLGFDPVVGVVITAAAACAAIVWMLRGAMPPRWAVVGGLLAATHPLILAWEQSRWGGGVALLGGAIVGGATLRLLRQPRWRHGLIFGIGAALLANSRPFEGLLLCAACLVAIGRATHSGERRPIPSLLRALLPATALLAPVVIAMAFYNWRVTGDPMRLPYTEHARQYMVAPLFWWQSPRNTAVAAPLYGNETLARFHGETEWREYADQRGAAAFARGCGGKIREIARDWLLPPATAVALLAGVWRARRDRHVRLAIFVWASVVLVHLLTTPWFRPHYLAPLGGFFFLVAAEGLRALFGVGRRRLGAVIVVVLLGVQAATAAWQIAGLMTRPAVAGVPRQLATVELLSYPPAAHHLVFVRYADGPQTILEWVYNSADMPGQRIIWARDLGEARNAELRADYPGRLAWMLEVRGLEYRLSPLN